MTAYRVVAEQDDESLVVFEEFELNYIMDAVYRFNHARYGQPGEMVLLQRWASEKEFPHTGWRTVDWREQEEN